MIAESLPDVDLIRREILPFPARGPHQIQKFGMQGGEILLPQLHENAAGYIMEANGFVSLVEIAKQGL